MPAMTVMNQCIRTVLRAGRRALLPGVTGVLALVFALTAGAADKNAFRKMRDAAKAGDAQAQHQLATAYLFGQVPAGKPDMREAFFWFQKAADQGIPEAQFKVGYFYENGITTRTNTSEASKWYQKAAEQGLAAAHLSLANIYYDAGDHVSASRSYRFAAESGIALAQRRLGEYYMVGQGGLERDPVEALKWMLLAIERGDTKAIERADSLRHNFLKAPDQVAEAERRAREFVPH